MDAKANVSKHDRSNEETPANGLGKKSAAPVGPQCETCWALGHKWNDCMAICRWCKTASHKRFPCAHAPARAYPSEPGWERSRSKFLEKTRADVQEQVDALDALEREALQLETRLDTMRHVAQHGLSAPLAVRPKKKPVSQASQPVGAKHPIFQVFEDTRWELLVPGWKEMSNFRKLAWKNGLKQDMEAGPKEGGKFDEVCKHQQTDMSTALEAYAAKKKKPDEEMTDAEGKPASSNEEAPKAEELTGTAEGSA